MSSTIDLKLTGDGAWPDLAGKDVIRLGESVIGMAVLDGGMVSGRESVAFRFTLPDGKVVVAETSWKVLAAAVLSVVARYGWPDRPNPMRHMIR
jgi:hypothetical protein